MTKELSRDLKIARSQSGLSNKDVAHLLACNKERVSHLENGSARIAITELLSLCMIYGRSLEDLFDTTAQRLITALKDRLSNIPAEPRNWSRKSKQRTDTLNALTNRLLGYAQHHGA